MIIDIKKPEKKEEKKLPEKVDTGRAIITDERVIKEYETLKEKEFLTAKEKLRMNRIKKYGDKSYAKHKMGGFKNHPTHCPSLATIENTTGLQSENKVRLVIEDIYNGVNLIEACEKHDLKPKFFFNVLEKEEFAEDKVNFLNARITLAEYYLYRREKLEKDLLEGKIDTPTYSALSSDYKYLAGKLAPLAYGDKIQLEARVNKSNTFEVINTEKVQELNNLLTSNIIDAEFSED